jgi:hypothetical protein
MKNESVPQSCREPDAAFRQRKKKRIVVRLTFQEVAAPAAAAAGSERLAND